MARSGIPLAPPSLIGASRALVVQKDAVGLRRILFKDRSITHTEHVIHGRRRPDVEPLGHFLEDMAWQYSLLRPPVAIHLGYTSAARRTTVRDFVFGNWQGRKSKTDGPR